MASYLGRTPAQRAAERRGRLLEATLSVWSAAEGSRVTMTRVCAEAGLTERYFYESFSNLDAALTAVVEALASEIEQVAQQAADAAGTAPEARVRAAMTAFVEAAALPGLRARRTQLLRHFARLSADGELPGTAGRTEQQRRMAGLMVVGGLAELVTAWLDGTLPASPEELADAATAMYLGLGLTA